MRYEVKQTTIGHMPKKYRQFAHRFSREEGRLIVELQVQDNILLTFCRGPGDSLQTLF